MTYTLGKNMNIMEYPHIQKCELCSVLKLTGTKCSHMNKIIPNLYLGASWNANNIRELMHYKIDTIVNVAYEIGCYYTDKFQYHRYYWDDHESFQILDDLDLVVDQIYHDIKNGKNVFVHCAMGISRSAAVIIAYLIKYENKNYEDAFVTVKKIRENINPNHGFNSQLNTFSQKIHKIFDCSVSTMTKQP